MYFSIQSESTLSEISGSFAFRLKEGKRRGSQKIDRTEGRKKINYKRVGKSKVTTAPRYM